MKVNKQTVLTLALGTALGTLIAIWLSPMARKLPPKENR